MSGAMLGSGCCYPVPTPHLWACSRDRVLLPCPWAWSWPAGSWEQGGVLPRQAAQRRDDRGAAGRRLAVMKGGGWP